MGPARKSGEPEASPGVLAKLFLAAFVALGSVWIAPSSIASKTGPNAYYEDALALMVDRQFEGAIIQLKIALQEDPGDLSSRLLIAQAYLAVEDGASAEKELLKAREGGADDRFVLVPLARAYLMQARYEDVIAEFPAGERGSEIESGLAVARGEAHLALRDLDLAERSFTKATELRPGSAAAMVGKAKIMLAHGDLELAASLARRAKTLDPDLAEAWYVAAETKRLARDLVGAAKDYGEAVKLDPRHDVALLARASVLIDLGRFDEAAENLESVRTRNPNSPRAAYLCALMLARNGDMKDARTALEAAAQILSGFDPTAVEKDPPTLLLAGVVHYFRRDLDRAHIYLQRYLQFEPRNASARKLFGALLVRRGEASEAIEVLRLARSLVPGNPEILVVLANAYLAAGRYAEATRTLERASELAPGESELVTKLSFTRLFSGEGDRVAEDLQTVVGSDPEEERARALLAVAHLKGGRYEAALEAAHQILDRNPDNPLAHNLIGGALLAMGDQQAARQSFEDALRADPDYTPAKSNLAKLDLLLGNTENAKKRYRAMLARDDASTDAMIALAEIAEREGLRDDAIRWLETARAASRIETSARLRLVELYLANGLNDQALETAYELRAINPNDPQFLATIGRAQIALGEAQAARETFDKMFQVATAVRSAKWLNRAGQFQLSVGDVSAAKASFDGALSIDEWSTAAEIGLFRIALQSNEMRQAWNRVKRLRTFELDTPIADTLAGEFHTRMGNHRKAAEAYDETCVRVWYWIVFIGFLELERDFQPAVARYDRGGLVAIADFGIAVPSSLRCVAD